MTRTTGSVPDSRTRIRPVLPSASATSWTAVRRVPAGYPDSRRDADRPPVQRNQRHGPVQQHLGRHPACCHHYDRYLHVPPALYVVAAVSGRGRAYRRCQRVEDLFQHHAAPGFQRHHHADDLQLHVALERLHPAAAGFV